MKKIIALLVVLAMTASLACAFAATPSVEDPSIIITGEGDVEIVWVDEGDAGDDAAEIIEEASAASQQGSALDVLPAEIRALIPESFTTVNEIRAMKLQGDLTKLSDLNVTFKFDTPYTPGSTVYLALAIPAEEGREWVLLEGKANDDSNVEVTFDVETLEKIGDKVFVGMAISES